MNEDIILVDNVKYKLWAPKDEIHEFEPIVLEHINDIFGENSIYVGKKKIETSAGTSSIPDGFVITLDGEPTCYVLEIEVSDHPAYDHGVAQLAKIESAMNNHLTHRKIVDAIYDSIRGAPDEMLIKNKTKKDLHKFLSDIITVDKIKSVIIIDSLNVEWREAFETRPTELVEFKTYARIKRDGFYVDPGSVHLHIFKPVVQTKYKPTPLFTTSKDWTYDSIENYLDELKKWNPASYAYFEILVKEDRILSREELIKLIGKKINDSEFSGYSLAGIQSGITVRTTKKGIERLDYKSDDSEEFGINEKYKSDLKKYFETASDVKTRREEYVSADIKLKEWANNEIGEYLDRLKKWRPASYAYFEILVKEDRIISREELIKLIGKKINDHGFSGYSLAGVQMGITSNSTKTGYERLDYKSEDSKNFGINKNYKRFLRKYFGL